MTRFVIAGPDWRAALVALIVFERFPQLNIAMACEPSGDGHELVPFVHSELSPIVAATISDAIVREWPSFVIAASGTIHAVPMTAGVFDPSQMIASASNKLVSVPPQAAHWQSVKSDTVWIDQRKLWDHRKIVCNAPAVISRWIDWSGPVDLNQLVLADFGDVSTQFHRQYIPLSPEKIFTRRVNHGAEALDLNFHGDPSSLALHYMRRYPSRLACMTQIVDIALEIVANAAAG